MFENEKINVLIIFENFMYSWDTWWNICNSVNAFKNNLQSIDGALNNIVLHLFLYHNVLLF